MIYLKKIKLNSYHFKIKILSENFYLNYFIFLTLSIFLNKNSFILKKKPNKNKKIFKENYTNIKNFKIKNIKIKK
jgi:hypothetical protein